VFLSLAPEKSREMFSSLALEADTIRSEARPYRYPLGLLFAIGEEAARGLGEWDIRILDNGFPGEQVAVTCSSELMSAAKSGNYDELARVTVRLYTEETTLYRDLNRAFREFEDTAESFLRDLEPDLGLGFGAMFRMNVPDGFGSLACYYDLLQ
jgi:hypothetical protein